MLSSLCCLPDIVLYNNYDISMVLLILLYWAVTDTANEHYLLVQVWFVTLIYLQTR